MKTTTSAGGGRGSGGIVRASSPHASPIFTVLEAEAVAYGSKVGVGRVEIAGVGVLEIEYFRPPNRAPFVTSRSIRNKFTGAYERTLELDPGLAEELREAVEARLNAEASPEVL